MKRIKDKPDTQFTIRGVPRHVEKALRRIAEERGESLNTVLVEALETQVVGAIGDGRHHDLDHLAGSWVEDQECDAALRAQDMIDKELWK